MERHAGNPAFFIIIHNQRLKLVLLCQIQLLSQSFQPNFNQNSAMINDMTVCMKYFKKANKLQ